MIASTDLPMRGNPVGRPPTILVVEEEVVVRLDIAAHLRSRAFQVFEAGDANEAIQLIEAHRYIDLVFSDVSLPGSLSGLDLARWIRHKRAGVQVLLTSGTPNEAHLAARECAVVPKPYHPRDIETTIRSLLRTNPPLNHDPRTT